MIWELQIAKAAKKNLRKFPKKDQRRVVFALRDFVNNPYFGDIEKIEGEANTWRRRIGNYRIIYDINIKNNLVLIRDIRRRTSTTY